MAAHRSALAMSGTSSSTVKGSPEQQQITAPAGDTSSWEDGGGEVIKEGIGRFVYDLANIRGKQDQ